MKILLIMTLSLITFSSPSLASKSCTLKLKLRTHLKAVSNDEILEIAKQITASSDIAIVDQDSDYSLELYASQKEDHHDTRFAYVHGRIEVWPSDQIQERSAIPSDLSSGFMKKRKLTAQLVRDLISKNLKAHLKSCEALDQWIKSTGNGTLTATDGQTYVTQNGAVFTRVGSYWRDPSGLLWGDLLPQEYTNATLDSPAVKACEALGARLPSATEFKNLMSYFSQSSDQNRVLSKEGQYEFNALFPWSFGMYTTSTRSESGVGYDFHHQVGVSSPAMAHWELNVRCVR